MDKKDGLIERQTDKQVDRKFMWVRSKAKLNSASLIPTTTISVSPLLLCMMVLNISLTSDPMDHNFQERKNG